MIVAGFGFRRAATLASLRSAYERAGAPDIDAVAAPEDKCTAPCLRDFARAMNLPVVAVSAADLGAVRTPTQSPRVRAMRGTGSVAEAAALVAAGPEATLMNLRVISEDRLATCSIATGNIT